MIRLPLSISRSTSLSAGVDALGYLKVSPLMTTADVFMFSQKKNLENSIRIRFSL